MKQVEILLATYNGEQYLDEQISSILSQTYSNWKLIIHDDGSTDNTTSIIEKYTELFPDKITFIDDGINKLGSCQNFSHLMAHSNADYIFFSDQDDIWLPHKIELSINSMTYLENAFPDIPLLFFTDQILVDEKLNYTADSVWLTLGLSPTICCNSKKLLLDSVIGGNTIVINSLAKQIASPIPKEAIMHDWWTSIMVSIHGKCFYTSVPTVLYRQHSQNVIGLKKCNHFKVIMGRIWQIRKKYRWYCKVQKMINKTGIHIPFHSYLFIKIKIFIEKTFIS